MLTTQFTNTHLDIDLMASEIFSDEYKDVIEVTFAYSEIGEGIYLNRTLFYDFLGETFDKDSVDFDIEKRYLQAKLKIENKQLQIQQILESVGDVTLSPKEKIFVNSLRYFGDILKLTYTGLPFEAEKAGMKISLSQKEREDAVSKMEQIEVGLFGGNVRENPMEIEEVQQIITQRFTSYISELTQDEQTRMKKYLHTSGIVLNTQNEKKTLPSVNQDFVLPEEIKEKKISRADYVEIFKNIFAIYGMQIQIIIEERSAIYDGEYALHIPIRKDYDHKSITDVLRIIAHEIETHYIINQNNKSRLGSFRGANNLPREEGLAMITEGILGGKTLQGVAGSGMNFFVYFAEMLPGKEYIDFLTLYSKVREIPFHISTVLRLKRNYPLYSHGAQHKDTTYSRGIRQMIEYIESGKSLKDLYVSKVSLDEIEDCKKIQPDAPSIIPILIAEMIQYKLQGKKLTKTLFKEHISKKYPFVNQDEFESTSQLLSFENKKRVLKILQILNK